MAKLIFHPELIPDKAAFAALCPFGAIEVHGDAVEPTAGCKMCGLCVKKGPAGAAEMVQDAPAPQVDKSAWRGILVYADHVEGALHPVTFELLGKARELAAEIGHPVYALLLGDGVKAAAEELTHWGAGPGAGIRPARPAGLPSGRVHRRLCRRGGAFAAHGPFWWAPPPWAVSWRPGWRPGCTRASPPTAPC